MASEEGESLAKQVEDVKVAADMYRSILHRETGNTQWRHGGPPIFYAVNKLFEEGRTKEWPQRSIEEAVQNAVKSREMEFYGVGITKVDASMRAEDVEIYYDPAELFGGLLKGKPISNSDAHEREDEAAGTLKLLKMDVPSQQEYKLLPQQCYLCVIYLIQSLDEKISSFLPGHRCSELCLSLW